MYVIIEVGTGKVLKDPNGKTYVFTFKDNADEVAQDLSFGKSDSDVVYTARYVSELPPLAVR
jgi:hypothetical protein